MILSHETVSSQETRTLPYSSLFPWELKGHLDQARPQITGGGMFDWFSWDFTMQAWAPEYGLVELEGIFVTSKTALSNILATSYMWQFKLVKIKENYPVCSSVTLTAFLGLKSTWGSQLLYWTVQTENSSLVTESLLGQRWKAFCFTVRELSLRERKKFPLSHSASEKQQQD